MALWKVCEVRIENVNARGQDFVMKYIIIIDCRFSTLDWYAFVFNVLTEMGQDNTNNWASFFSINIVL